MSSDILFIMKWNYRSLSMLFTTFTDNREIYLPATYVEQSVICIREDSVHVRIQEQVSVNKLD
jgi:hypothetical protein